MKRPPVFSATTAGLSALLLLAASPCRATAATIPGTPVDGTNDGGSILVMATTAEVGTVNPYFEAGDSEDAHSAVPGDVVILTPVTGSLALDEDRSNWAAVARFYSPADPDGSKGADATQEVGFLATALPGGPATDFTTFALLPNVFYVNASSITPDEVITGFTEFSPAGIINLPQQTGLFVLSVAGVPEPASVGVLGLGGALLLGRRRRWRPIPIAGPMD